MENATSKDYGKIIKNILFVVFAFAMVGFLDATYLTYKHFFGTPVVCPILKDGCFKVAQSRYADFFGIPTPLLGSIFYLMMFALILRYFLNEEKVVLKMIGALSFFGFLVSVVLTYVHAYVLKSFCFFCLISAVSSVLIFIFGIVLFVLSKKIKPK